MPTIRTASAKGAKLTPNEADANMKRTPVEKTGDYTLDATHNREFHYLTTAVSTVTLPDISAATIESGDWEVTLYNTQSTAVTVSRNSQNINGAAANLTLAAGQVVTLCADAAPDAFYTKSFKDPTTTRGDLMVRGASSLSRLAVGTAGYFLRSDGTDAAWATPYQAVTVYLSTDQAHSSSGNWVDIAFNVEAFDPLATHSAGIFTIPAWANKARFSAVIFIEGNGSSSVGRRGARVVTGAGALLTPTVHNVKDTSADINGDTSIEIVGGIIPVTAGGTYKFQAYQNSGGTLQINGTSGATWATVEFFP